MKKILLCCMLLLSLGITAQPILTFKIDTVCHTPPGNVLVPVRVDNFLDIASISVEVIYDINALDFTGNYTTNTLLQGGFFVLNQNAANTIQFAWFGLNPLSLQNNDILIELEFNHLQGSGSVGFVPVVGTTFINGMVSIGPVQITQQPDTVTVIDGSPAYFQITSSMPLGTLYQWQESTDNGVSWVNLTNTGHYHGTDTDLMVVDTATNAMSTYLYRCHILNCGGLYSDIAELIVYPNSSISGDLNYLNANNSPITGTVIFFWNNGNLAYSTTTDANGHFEIPYMLDGIYDLTINCLHPWGGGNAVDGLMILQHFTGMITLSGLPLQAADADNSGAINSVDALLVLKRFVGMIQSFPSNDWIYDTSQIQVLSNQANTVSIKTLCTGDVNGSYNP